MAYLNLTLHSLLGDAMESLREVAVAKVLLLLYKKGKLYTTELAKQPEYTLSWRHLNRILPSMIQDGLVKADVVGNKKFYSLTVKGKALAWALSNPDGLAALSGVEETAGVGGKVEVETIQQKIDSLERYLPSFERTFSGPTTKMLKKALKLMKEELRKRRNS
jgi:DNA-binding HxlR family transcriptional regulator